MAQLTNLKFPLEPVDRNCAIPKIRVTTRREQKQTKKEYFLALLAKHSNQKQIERLVANTVG